MKIKISNIDVNYIDCGEGDTVVLLHGWGSSYTAFNYIIKELSEKFRTVALDFPGFGQSGMIPEPWSVSDYVDFLSEFLKALNIENPVLIGHSFGGRVIIKGVGSGKLSASKIILLDSAGVKPKQSLKSKLRLACFKCVKGFLMFPLWRKPAAGLLDKARAHFGSSDYNSAPPVLRQTLVKAVTEDLQCYMPSIAAPTLLIWGENDTATPLSDAKIMERLIPDSGLCVIKGGGHFSFIDSPYEVNAIISCFLGG